MTNNESNVPVAHRLIDLYNTDVHRMIDEVYANVDVVCPGALEIHDRQDFHAIEQIALDVAPDRKAHILRTIDAADRVILEGDVTYTDQKTGEQRQTFWCGIFTFQDSRVISDRTYLNPAEWPGGQQMADYLASQHEARLI
jgi:hypothetical protein